MRIFGHGFHRKTPDIIQRFTANHGAGAAEEGRIPVIVALLNRAIEQHPFIGDVAADGEVAFKRVRRIEIVRGLHQRQHRVFEEAANRRLQEHAGRHVVTVEDANQLSLSQGHRVVQVTRFGVFIIITGDIADADIGGEHRKFATFPVVQQIDFHFIRRVIDTLRSQHGIAHDFQRFVIAGNINIDRRPRAHIIGQRDDFSLQRPDRLQVVQQQHYPDIDFRQKQPHPQHRLNGGVKMQGLRQAKIHIAGRHQQRSHDHNDRNTALFAKSH